MRNAAGRLVLIAAALVWAAGVGHIIAEEGDVQPQASPRQPGQQTGQSSGGSNNNSNNEEESQSVERQMQTLKRELRGQKADPSQTAPIRDGEHQFQLKVPNYVAIRQRNIVMQQRDFSCGAACLATICRYYWGDDVTEDKVLTTLDLMLTAEETEDRIK